MSTGMGLRECYARVAELEANQAPAWQPIETAPKDGTEILSAVKGTDQVLIVRWEAYGRDGKWFYDNDGYTWPTHWMPLPDPPNG